MSASSPGERFTAATSAIVAVAILGAAVTAQQAHPPRGDVLARLESDLRLQFDLAFGHDYALHQAHVRGLERTLDEWRRSPQSEDDHRLLVIWFRDAIVASMPGRVTKMPRRPAFSSRSPASRIDDADRLLEVRRRAPAPGEPQPLDQEREASGVATRVPETTDSAPTLTPYDLALAEHAVGALEVEPTPTPADDVVGLSASVPADPDREPSATGKKPSPAGVQVNLAELNARVRGYHVSLAEIEAEILAGNDVSAVQLALLVTRLEKLAGQYQFVRLYYESLTPRERRIVASPRPMAETVRLVEQRLADADGDFLNDFDAREGSSRTLAERLRALKAAAGDAR